MTEPGPQEGGDTRGLPMPRRALAVFGITIPAVLSVLDGAMLTVALPGIAVDLAVSPQTAVWVVSACQLMTVVCLLPMTVVADRLGYRRTFSGGILLYAMCSLAAAQAGDFASIVLTRILQGLALAGVTGCASALLRATYPERLFGTGVALNTSAVTLAAAAGPSVGALVLTVGESWRTLFLIGVPFSLAAWVCARALPAPRGVPRPLRPASVVLNVLAPGLGIIGLSALPRDGIAGGLLLLASGLAWGSWVRIDRRARTPLLPLDLFGVPAFGFAVAASAAMFAAQSTALVALPFFLLESRALSMLQTGTLMTVWPICASATSLIANRLRQRFDVATLCMAGAVLLIAGLGWILVLPPWLPHAWLGAGFLLGGIAVGCFQAPNMHAMLSATPRARAGAAGSIQAMARVGGATLGASLAGMCFAVSGAAGPSFALIGAGALAALAFLVNAARRHAL